jgi:nitrile hydratase accessory protein
MTGSSSAETRVMLADILEQSKGVGEAVFLEPWMARAFGLTIALSEKGLFSLKEFQAALIEAVGHHEKAACITNDAEYYTRWIEALMTLLRQRALLSDAELSAIEENLIAEAAARKEHQHFIARNADGSLKIVPIAVA